MSVSITEKYTGAVSTFEEFIKQVKVESQNTDLIELADHNLEILSNIKSTLGDEFNHAKNQENKLKKQRLAALYKQPEHANNFSCTPSFIIGNRRSGTTLLSALINASDNIAALPENFFAGNVSCNDDLFKFGHKLTTRLELSEYKFFNGLGKLIDNLYNDFTITNNKSRWISKEIFRPHRLDRLDHLFDYHGKFIYIVRHGFSVAHSCAERFPHQDGEPYGRDSSINVETYLRQWIKTNELTLNFYERNKPRCLMVKYEELTKKPELITQKVYEFLDEPWHTEVLERWGEQLDSRKWVGDNLIHHSNGKIIEENKQKWLEWPDSLIQSMARIANPTLVRLGYDEI